MAAKGPVHNIRTLKAHTMDIMMGKNTVFNVVCSFNGMVRHVPAVQQYCESNREKASGNGND